MGNYLNPGNDMFYKMVHSEIYVDKTGLIGYCNHVINTMQRYICVSRPRRFGKSMAMLSDAIHSLSDVFGSIIVIIGVKVSKKKEDADHPFGHDRLECLASLALGAILFFTGAMLAYEGIDKIYTKAPISTPGKIALFAAIVSIIAKEGMFWYTKINANRINSDALRAEAWHHRSDALSSVGSLIGVAGAMLGLKILDPIMGCVIGLVIIKVAFDIAKEAILRNSTSGRSAICREIC